MSPLMILILRSVKGSKLTISEMDGNFVYLENLANSNSGVTGPPGATGSQGPTFSISVPTNSILYSVDGSSVIALTGTSDIPIIIWGYISVGATGGTLAFQWAQNTSNAGATTVYQGSFLEYQIVT